jgi:hypothetical protein
MGNKMKTKSCNIFNCFVIILFCCWSCASGENSNLVNEKDKEEKMATVEELAIEHYDGDFFSLNKPSKWKISTVGNCSSFSFRVYDPDNENNQVFMIGELGPIYLNENQKMLDLQAINYWGMEVKWIEMPVIIPLTPENYLLNLGNMRRTNYCSSHRGVIPSFDKIEIISSKKLNPLIINSQYSEMRVVISNNNATAEGIIGLSVIQLIESLGSPGTGIGYGMSIYGFTYETGKFEMMAEVLTKMLNSFKFDENYYKNCIAQIQAANNSIYNTSNMLSQMSDEMYERYSQRNQSDDITAAKRSDAMLNYERLYDPETGDVYRVNQDFYDSYIRNETNYQMNNLEPIPSNNYDLWTKPTLNERDIR